MADIAQHPALLTGFSLQPYSRLLPAVGVLSHIYVKVSIPTWQSCSSEFKVPNYLAHKHLQTFGQLLSVHVHCLVCRIKALAVLPLAICIANITRAGLQVACGSILKLHPGLALHETHVSSACHGCSRSLAHHLPTVHSQMHIAKG